MTVRDHRVFDVHVHMQPWEMLKPAVYSLMGGGRADAAEIEAYQQDAAGFERYLRDVEGVDRAGLINYVSPDVMGFTEDVNAWMSAYAKGRDAFVPFGSVHPARTDDAARDVRHLVRDLGLRALKVHPNHQLLYPNAYATEGLAQQAALYEAAERERVPVTFHTGTSIFAGARNRFAEPLALDDVAIDYPDLKLVLAHAGRPFWMDQAFFLARRHDNVYLDLSGIPPRKLLEYLPRAEDVAPKLLFGSDWPSPGVRSIRANVEAMLDLPLTDATKQALLWDNPVRVFG